MPPYRVYVTSNEVPERALGILRSVASVSVNPNPGPPTRRALEEGILESDGVLTLLTDRIDVELMMKAKKLKVIANIAVGYDNIDVAEATKKSIQVTNTPDVLTETTADFAMALILAVARRVVEADRFVREGRWQVQWSPMLMVGSDVHGKILGIYGMGRIGAAVARRARGFGMKTLYYSRARRVNAENGLGIEYAPFDDVLKRSDFLTIHVPLTPSTRHSIGVRELRLMKKEAFLINTSRGPIVDEVALANALASRKIAGAALDVFEKEPLSKESPLLKMDNVIVLPHMASASLETRTAMAIMAARNIASSLLGETPPNLVNLKDSHSKS